MFPALFLDRDGVIIKNRENYVRSWEDVAVYPQALAALVKISKLPVKVVIVTNQSVVGRGYIDRDTAEEINRRLVATIADAGARVDRVYMCPHAPEDACNCRKPRPGMLLQAAKELSLTLENSVLIGDALTDVQAGRAVGIRHLGLVRTGRGEAQLALPEAASVGLYRVYADLQTALDDLAATLRLFSLLSRDGSGLIQGNGNAGGP